ncbi:MAG: hypothetical protein COX40_03910 [Candidatus Omnitrophica bacterium CG23_combo_of_CG06-09_8_20_14_all_40_11]|nr:MAG: hypothetical protein COX40_03910 [Candidatus Omnitrophica bacterium CG23_combo_of_CG06-09_8_20_14_all_40_11]
MNKEQLLELIIAWLAGIPMIPVLILFSLIGLAVGAFMVIKPSLSIEIQRRFYCLINWKIEPISLSKEIRNTRAMGWFLIILSIITIALVF